MRALSLAEAGAAAAPWGRGSARPEHSICPLSGRGIRRWEVAAELCSGCRERADRCSFPEKPGGDPEEGGGCAHTLPHAPPPPRNTHTHTLASRVGEGGAQLSAARKARGAPGNRRRARGGAAAATLERAGDW